MPPPCVKWLLYLLCWWNVFITRVSANFIVREQFWLHSLIRALLIGKQCWWRGILVSTKSRKRDFWNEWLNFFRSQTAFVISHLPFGGLFRELRGYALGKTGILIVYGSHFLLAQTFDEIGKTILGMIERKENCNFVISVHCFPSSVLVEIVWIVSVQNQKLKEIDYGYKMYRLEQMCRQTNKNQKQWAAKLRTDLVMKDRMQQATFGRTIFLHHNVCQQKVQSISLQ